ncbi:sugar ABC transporter ATP-binding protein [Amycolatopsis ultiminotia]|uniref:Sugar ABC transporter ATP-binding protein n=1 Tax=Amycolatopsis ultiminotia TaxID=543629 RepID=A0ABP6V676_9PSEU
MTTTRNPVLQLQGVHKSYGNLVALSDAGLTVTAPGEVHALGGENGSGKSTLLGVLSGQTRPDKGEILLDGRRVSFRNPADAIAHGICMVSQETSIAPDLTAGENVLLGRLERRWWGVDRSSSVDTARGYLGRLGSRLDPRTPARELRADQLQIVEIARALSMNARILILDEPTSSLAADEADALLEAIDELRRDDVVVLFVSHRMPEVFAIADRITVLRDGSVAYTGPAETQSAETLVTAMLGEAKAAHDRELSDTRTTRLGDVALEVSDLTAPGAFEDIGLSVRHGEIVGLAGLEGAGRSELLESLFGVRPVTGGRISVDGRAFTPRNPRAAIDAGVAYLPPDRKERGLVLSMSTLGNAGMVGTLGRKRWRRPAVRHEQGLIGDLVRRTRLRVKAPHEPVGTLSGGNQQKVSLGKWLVAGQHILLLDEPTRGVDVGAKMEIHALLRAAADDGAAVLVSSSENEELLAVCDRILVMARRRVVAEVSAAGATLGEVTRLSREGVHEPVD